MSLRRPARPILLLASVLGLSWGLVVPSAIAGEAASEVGWWWIGRPSDTFPVAFTPVPPVPEGGFYVAGDPAGPRGVSALRFSLGSDARVRSLTITVADSIGDPVIDACVASSAWEPTAGGPWDERPIPRCEEQRISGALSEDGGTVSFDLLGLDAPESVDLVLLPGDPADGAPPAAFAVSFEPPRTGALALTVGAGGQPPSAVPPAAPPEARLEEAAPPSSVRSRAPRTNQVPIREAEVAERMARQPGRTSPVLADRVSGAGFAYPAILGLPLLLTALGWYLVHALTQPVPRAEPAQ